MRSTNCEYSVNVIDTRELCVEEGQLVWVLYVDLYCLDYDGNFLDAAIVALVSALRAGVVTL